MAKNATSFNYEEEEAAVRGKEAAVRGSSRASQFSAR
jgi:hypothetical protein